MVRFGAKKEEFIPPFLFYLNLTQKRGNKALSVFLIKYLFMHFSHIAHLQHPNLLH